MSHKNIYALLIFLKINNIKVESYIKDIIKTVNNIEEKEFLVFKLDKQTIIYYFSFDNREILFKLIKSGITNHDELKYFYNLIINNKISVAELLEACLNPNIRKNSTALSYLSKIKNKECMREFRLACNKDYIRDNPNLLDVLFKIENWQAMRELWIAFNYKIVRENLDFVKFLSKKTHDVIRELVCAYLKSEIRNNPELFLLIVNLNDAEKISEITKASERIEDPEILLLIAKCETLEQMQEMHYACLFKELRNNPVFLEELFNCKSKEEMRNCTLTYLGRYKEDQRTLEKEYLINLNGLLNSLLEQGNIDEYIKMCKENWFNLGKIAENNPSTLRK